MAAAVTTASSRSSAPLAFTVRIAPSARSSAVPIVPTATWAASTARPMRGSTTSTPTAMTPSTPSVTSSRGQSSTPMSTIVPSSARTPLNDSTTPVVVAACSSVVSEVTRESRSPSGRWSSSLRRRRSIRPASRTRARNAIRSATRSSIQSWMPASSPETTTSPDSSSTGRRVLRPSAPSASMSSRAASGCASADAFAHSPRTTPSTSVRRCGRTYASRRLRLALAGGGALAVSGIVTHLPRGVGSSKRMIGRNRGVRYAAARACPDIARPGGDGGGTASRRRQPS